MTERSERPAPSPATGPVRLFALCLVASVVASGFALPFRVGAIVFIVIGAVAGVRALVLLMRSDGRLGVVLLVAGLLVLSLLLFFGEVARLAFWSQYSAYQECTSRAITLSASTECRDQLDDDLPLLRSTTR